MPERKPIARNSAFSVARAVVAREARRARAGLWVEAVIRAFWPLWTVFALGLGLILWGAPALLPREAHFAFLAALAAALLFFAARGAVRLTRWRPTQEEALARLDEGVRGRPAETLEDALVAGAGDSDAETLWAAHQRRLAEKAATLKARAPDLRASGFDLFALRHGALLVLITGAMAYFGADATRLADQFRPVEAVAGPPEIGPSLEAWASPPLYTGVAPVYLTRLADASGAPISLPEGTEISLRVFDADPAPVLAETLSGDAAAFEDRGAQVHDATLALAQSGEISVTLGERVMGAWRLEMIPDEAPTISFRQDPQAGARGAMVLEYQASDDYGVRYAGAEIRLDTDAPPPVAGAARPSPYDPVRLDLPLPLTGDSRTVSETMVEDLSEHPWAGLPVVFTIRAEDAAGQGAAAERRVIMPARIFTHPMARALIEQRRNLAYSPDAAPRVLDVLEAVMLWPEEVFDDTTGYLAARMAVRRLGYALEDGRVDQELKSVVDLLWKAAIRLEDGDLSSAAARLARAQERLKEAIEQGAPEDEISRLMQELREAMQDYLSEMAREAERDQANGEQQQGQQGERQTITQQDLEEMLRELEEALRNGQTELARQMMQALQQLMNNLQMAQPGQGQPGQGEQMMNQMGDMIGEQQGLADRSFNQMRREQRGRSGQQQGGGDERGQEGEQSGSRGDDPGQIARDQQALRQLLDDLRGELPGGGSEETRRALDQADQAMNDAVDALEEGDTRSAVDDQVRALDALREGRQQLGRDLAEAQGRRDGQQAGRDGRGGDARDEDPLGRPRSADGSIDGLSTKVPGAGLGKRARELQEEIRRRAGERQRPPPELDYLERLLDRF